MLQKGQIVRNSSYHFRRAYTVCVILSKNINIMQKHLILCKKIRVTFMVLLLHTLK